MTFHNKLRNWRLNLKSIWYWIIQFETVSSILSKFQLKKGRLDPGPENVLKLLPVENADYQENDQPTGSGLPPTKRAHYGILEPCCQALTRKSSPWVGALARGRSEGFMQSISPASRRFGTASRCAPWLSLNPPGPERGGGLWGHGALNLNKRFPLLLLESHAGFQIECSQATC